MLTRPSRDMDLRHPLTASRRFRTGGSLGRGLTASESVQSERLAHGQVLTGHGFAVSWSAEVLSFGIPLESGWQAPRGIPLFRCADDATHGHRRFPVPRARVSGVRASVPTAASTPL